MKKNKTIVYSSTTRKMTEEEKEETRIILEKEAARYKLNELIGGIDERGNYTALHHR